MKAVAALPSKAKPAAYMSPFPSSGTGQRDVFGQQVWSDIGKGAAEQPLPDTTPGPETVAGYPSSGVMKHEAELARRAMGTKMGDYPRSVVDLMKLAGMDSSAKSRRLYAEALGYKGPNRSYERNVFLRNKLMQQFARMGAGIPGGPKATVPMPRPRPLTESEASLRARPEVATEEQLRGEPGMASFNERFGQWPANTESTHTIKYKIDRDQAAEQQFQRASIASAINRSVREATWDAFGHGAA
jgi:hypothetical protein